MKPTTMVRLWSLQNVFLLWLVRPKIVELNENRCVVRIPLNWITRRRDIHAMYLGTLCMGADVAAGLIAFLTLALTWLSVALGLVAKSVESASNPRSIARISTV